MAQHSHPTLINLPQPPSNPETPSETPGTPTSATTSLSALSTTAIKDGHRGEAHHAPASRGHQHHSSATSLDAERADRISRLTGLSSVSTLHSSTAAAGPQHDSPQTTPTSNAPPANVNFPYGVTPAYFDAAGQPVAATKMSTVGTASATESVGGHTTAGTGGDMDVGRYGDEGMLSTGTADGETETETEMDSASASACVGDTGDPMDEDMDQLGTRSNGGFEDRMSDDGTASLVGFGEGAGSTVSGPIYHRRPLAGQNSAAAGMGLERTGSEVSDSPLQAGANTARRDTIRALDREGSNDATASQTTTSERGEARVADGMPSESALTNLSGASGASGASGDVFVDTANRGPLRSQPPVSSIRETQQPYSAHQHVSGHSDLPREAAGRHGTPPA